MWSFIKGLFTDKPSEVMEIAKGVGGWIDEQQFTEEEKSKAAFVALEYQLKWLNATQGMNTARRYLALMFSFVFLFTFMICVIAAIYGFTAGVEVKPLVDSVTAIVESYEVGWIVVTMIVFYFGKGIAESRFGGTGK